MNQLAIFVRFQSITDIPIPVRNAIPGCKLYVLLVDTFFPHHHCKHTKTANFNPTIKSR